MHIHCLTFEGGSLNDIIRNILFDIAQEMMEDGQEKRAVKSGVCEGEIKTDGEQFVIAGFCGTRFEAQLDTNWGSRSVVYLVRPVRNHTSKDFKWHRAF